MAEAKVAGMSEEEKEQMLQLLLKEKQTASTPVQATPSRDSQDAYDNCKAIPKLPPHKLSNELHPYLLEFQRRAEDEMAKMFHQVIKYAADKDKHLKFENSEKKYDFHQEKERAIGIDSVDFRWQLKHFKFNRPAYARLAKNRRFGEEIQNLCESLKTKTDEVVHKQPLFVRTMKGQLETPKPEDHNDIQSIEAFFEKSIALVDLLYKNFEKEVPSLKRNQGNLHSIHRTFKDMCKYRECYKANLEENLSLAEKEECFARLMEHLRTASGDSKMCRIVAVEFSAQCQIPICETETSLTATKEIDDEDTDEDDEDGNDTEEFSQQGVKPPLGSVRSVTDNLLGLKKYILNPFCSSNLEMQRRLEDQLALFFRNVMKQKMEAGLIPRRNNLHDNVNKNISDALKEPISFDFRALMDHIDCYKRVYAPNKEDEITIQMNCAVLKEMALQLAHKHHLRHRYSSGRQKAVASGKPGTKEALRDFLDYGFNLAKKIAHEQFIQSQELHGLKQIIDEFKAYRWLHANNIREYHKMDPQTDQQRTTAVTVLSKIEARKDKLIDLVVYEFSSRCDIKLSQFQQAPQQRAPDREPQYTSKNLYSLLSIESLKSDDSDENDSN